MNRGGHERQRIEIVLLLVVEVRLILLHKNKNLPCGRRLDEHSSQRVINISLYNVSTSKWPLKLQHEGGAESGRSKYVSCLGPGVRFIEVDDLVLSGVTAVESICEHEVCNTVD